VALPVRLIAATLAVVAIAFVAPASASVRTAKPRTPAYASPGPFAAGVTTLDLSDRKVEVWYPANKKTTLGAVPDSYDLLAKVPPAVAGLFPVGTDATFKTDA